MTKFDDASESVKISARCTSQDRNNCDMKDDKTREQICVRQLHKTLAMGVLMTSKWPKPKLKVM